MENKVLEQRYRDYLKELPLGVLRILGRKRGVQQAAARPKDELIEAIIDVLTGKVDPAPPQKRGATVKENFLDPAILHRLDVIHAAVVDELQPTPPPARENTFTVASPERTIAFEEPVYSGILEITQGGYGFLRAKNLQPSNNGSDVFIAAPVIHGLRLREGDSIACTVRPSQKNDSPAMETLLSVNNLPIGRYEQRPLFDNLVADYPREKNELSKGEDKLSLRILDLLIPIGKGQRALIVAPPKAGKTTLLKNIAHAINVHHPAIDLIVLLIDERPEEVTDFRTSVMGAQIFSSTFDEGAEHHVRAAALTLAHAKRLAEMGKHVVILLDSLTKLTRAYNYVTENTGKILTGGLDAGALADPKRFFGAARNTKEAGSITILATALVDTGSRMDDIIYEEFKGTGNADIFLSRDLAERRIFPAIDIRRSGTRKEDLLLTKEELAAVYKLRERGIVENAAGFLEMLSRTPDNETFVARLPEWLRVYKS